jgi:chemotaxis signal transduction protein
VKPDELFRFEVAPSNVTLLEERARQLSTPDDAAESLEASTMAVSFQLGPARFAVDMEQLVRAVTRLGTVAVLPHAAPGIRGVAFVDGVPHLIFDLCERAIGAARPLGAICAGPALLVRHDKRAIAIAVDGPLDLLPVRASAASALDEQDIASLRIAGRLEDGTLRLSPSWFRTLVDSLGEP